MVNVVSCKPRATFTSTVILSISARQPDVTHISDVIISVRHEIGILRADIMKRFDQNAAVAAALRGRINQAEDNTVTHCYLDTLNYGVAQAQNNLTP